MHNADMDPSLTHPRRHIVDGTIRVFLAEALILPTGLVTVIFLTRRLGPEGYGLFTLAAVLMNWIGWTIPSLLSRASIKFVSEAPDWRSVGTIVLRLYLTLSCVAALLLFFLAGPVSGLLNEPSLTACLRLFAIEIPLFSLAVAHRNILTGIGKFRQRALTSAGRWSSRLILIVLLVEMGFSVHGAILGSIGAALVEMVIGRFYVRPSLFHRSSFPARRLFSYAVPLSFFALTMQLFTKLDLIMLKLLGGTTEQAGFYGAAQNLSIVPGIFALSFSPLLLSTLSQMLGAGEGHSARDLGRDAMRTVTWLLPVAGILGPGLGYDLGGHDNPYCHRQADLAFCRDLANVAPGLYWPYVAYPTTWACRRITHNHRAHHFGRHGHSLGRLQDLARCAASSDIYAKYYDLRRCLCPGYPLACSWILAPCETTCNCARYPACIPVDRRT
jgi:hypothetical protein